MQDQRLILSSLENDPFFDHQNLILKSALFSLINCVFLLCSHLLTFFGQFVDV